MKARPAPIDFSDAKPWWTPKHPPVGHGLNGGSVNLPYLEPYLIKVMKQARKELETKAPELIPDVDVFIQQEANHFATHARFNAVLREKYDGMEALEDEIRRDFEGFMERDLRWNLAYSEGFESMGLVQSELFFEQIDGLLEDADPAVLELWRWHLAEEFEHRCVCHDVYHALYGRGIGSWWFRIRVFVYTVRHLQGFGQKVARHLLAQDAAAGRLPTGWRYRLRSRLLGVRMRLFALPRFFQVLMPWYTPRRRGELPPAERFLAALEA